jgi:hypothetical protein
MVSRCVVQLKLALDTPATSPKPRFRCKAEAEAGITLKQ